MIRCNTCMEEKDETEFYKDLRNKGGFWKRCRSCHTQAKRNWRSRNTGAARRYHREYKLRLLYGLSPEDYQTMLDSQDGKCAICRSSSSEILAVDHDHGCCPGSKSCGKCIRGLLCASCNKGLGFLGNNPDLLQSASDYLERHIVEKVLLNDVRGKEAIHQVVQSTITRKIQ